MQMQRFYHYLSGRSQWLNSRRYALDLDQGRFRKWVSKIPRFRYSKFSECRRWFSMIENRLLPKHSHHRARDQGNIERYSVSEGTSSNDDMVPLSLLVRVTVVANAEQENPVSGASFISFEMGPVDITRWARKRAFVRAFTYLRHWG